MLKIQANLIHKSIDLRPPVCQIEKIIIKPHDEFMSLAYHPYADYGFITENRDMMGNWDNKNHCLLVLDEGGSDGLLINASGYDSIRYGAFVSHARDYIEREMERAADYMLRDITPDDGTGDISIYLEDIEDYTGAEVRDDSEIARMFYSALQKHPGVAEVTPVDDCLVVTPKTGQSQGAAAGLKLRDVLLLGNMENVYMAHEYGGDFFVAAEDFAMLTAKGREDYAALLDAAVSKIHRTEDGVEVVLSGVEPQLLMDFFHAADAHNQAESMMGPTM